MALEVCTEYAEYPCKDDPKRGWGRERCLQFLESGDEQRQRDLEKLSLLVLRVPVEGNSGRTKWRARALAEDMGQRLSFTPPHVGKLLSPIELYLAIARHRYKRIPKTDIAMFAS